MNTKIDQNSKIFYVYKYIDPRDNKKFYVGEGHDKKQTKTSHSHLKKCYNKRFAARLKELKELNIDPIIEIDRGYTKQQALLETFWISFYGRKDIDQYGILMNYRLKNSFGNLGTIQTKKRIVSEKTREKLRIASTGRNHSEETKLKLKIHFTGKSPTEETREKLRVASTGRKDKPETIEKKKIAKLGKIISNEVKIKMSNAKVKKTYSFIDPKGQTIIITNLTKFCRENNLRTGNMSLVYYKKRKSHLGYTSC